MATASIQSRAWSLLPPLQRAKSIDLFPLRLVIWVVNMAAAAPPNVPSQARPWNPDFKHTDRERFALLTLYFSVDINIGVYIKILNQYYKFQVSAQLTLSFKIVGLFFLMKIEIDMLNTNMKVSFVTNKYFQYITVSIFVLL